MFCKWCGLESDTSDACSWCHQPFTTTSQPTPPIASSQSAPAKPDANVYRPLPGAVPLGDLDDFDDDLSPVPFAPIAPTVQTRPVVPSPPPTLPSAGTPIAPPTGKGYQAAESKSPPDRPDLQAIPIKKPGSDLEHPAIIPIARTPSPPVQKPAPEPAPAVSPEPAQLDPIVPAPITERTAAAAPSEAVPIADPPSVSALPVDRTPQPLGDFEIDEPQVGTAPPRPSASPARGAQMPLTGDAHKEPAGGVTATAVRTGVKVYCRWCGMESDTPEVCSWCRKDIRSQSISRPLESLKRTPTPASRGAKPADVKPAISPNPEGNGNGAPTIGTFTAQKSRYYPDKVYDPVSGAHYDADTGVAEPTPRVTESPEDDSEQIYPLNQLAVNVALLVGIAFFAVVFLQRQPSWYLSILGVSNFFAGMAMPLLRTVPFGEDDSSDLGIAIGLTLVLGPLVGAILYFFICFVRQDFSPGIVGVFVTYLLLRFTMDITLGIPISRMMPWSEFTAETVGAQIMPFVTIAGWYAAGMFHKPDE